MGNGRVVQPRPLTRAQERLWRSLTRLLVVLHRSIDEDLIARTGLSLTSYITLSHLSEAPEGQLGMSKLAEHVALSPSRMTRVVHALEEDGFVTRRVSRVDQRASLASITEAGLERLRAAWPSHLASVRELAMDHIERGEIAQLTEILERLVNLIERRA